MTSSGRLTFPKQERMVSRQLIETLFGGKCSHSLATFPLRIVYRTCERQADDAPVQLLVSVSKRHFKHAVDRNKVKRQIREAYRLHKSLLNYSEDQCVAMAFIWLDNKHHSSRRVEHCVTTLLKRMKERL